MIEKIARHLGLKSRACDCGCRTTSAHALLSDGRESPSYFWWPGADEMIIYLSERELKLSIKDPRCLEILKSEVDRLNTKYGVP